MSVILRILLALAVAVAPVPVVSQTEPTNAIDGATAYRLMRTEVLKADPEARLIELQTGVFSVDQDGNAGGWSAKFVSASSGQMLVISFSYGELHDLGAMQASPYVRAIENESLVNFDSAEIYRRVADTDALPFLEAGGQLSLGLTTRATDQKASWYANISDNDHRVLFTVILDADTLEVARSAPLGDPEEGLARLRAARAEPEPSPTEIAARIAELGLPAPPPGYRWQVLGDLNAAVVLPEDWAYSDRSREPLRAFFLTEEAFPRYGTFDAGLSIVVLTVADETSAAAEARSSQERIRDFRPGATTFESSLAGRAALGVDYLGQGQMANHSFRDLYVADDGAKLLYQFFLKAPTERWDRVQKVLDVMLEHIVIEDP